MYNGIRVGEARWQIHEFQSPIPPVPKNLVIGTSESRFQGLQCSPFHLPFDNFFIFFSSLVRIFVFSFYLLDSKNGASKKRSPKCIAFSFGCIFPEYFFPLQSEVQIVNRVERRNFHPFV